LANGLAARTGRFEKNNVKQIASIFMNPGTPESFVKSRQRLKPGRRLFFVDNPTRMI
jgi:hypothetical protein